MNSENRQVKKRKKGPNPIVRFTLIVILLITVGFFVFYSIDNPDFIKSMFSSNSDENQVEEGETVLPDTGENDAVDTTEESVQAGDSGESGEEDITEGETTPDEVSDNNETTTGLSLWQRIKNFFLGLTGADEEETYDDTLEINFYFSGLGEEKKLVSEKKTINAGSPDNAVKNAVQELLKGPSKSYHFPVIPAGTELLDAETYENTAKIDLSQEFLENSLDTRILDEFIIYSIVNTLTEIPEIEGVVFYIEGIRIKVYGNIDLSIPAIRNTEYIKEDESDEEQLNEDQSGEE
jgi:hypothetical protein